MSKLPLLPSWYKNTVPVLFFLYGIAIMTSTAGMEIFLALLVVFAIIGAVILRRKKVLKLADLKVGCDPWVWMFFVVTILGTALYADGVKDIYETFDRLRWILFLYGLSFLLRIFFTSTYEKYFTYLLVAAGITGLYSLFQYITGKDLFRATNDVLLPVAGAFRATGFFNISLTYSYVIGMCFFYAAAYLYVKRSNLPRKALVFSLIGVVGTLIGILVSLSLGAWIAAGIALPLISSLVRRGWVFQIVMTVALFFILFAAVPAFHKKIAGVVEEGNRSNLYRLAIWSANLEIFIDHPVLGVGYGRNPKYLMEYYKKLGLSDISFISHAHNDYLEVLAGTGLFGLVAFLGFSIYFLWLAYFLWKTLPEEDSWKRSLALGALGAQIFMHIGGLTQCNFIDIEITHLTVLSWSVLVALKFQMDKSLKVTA